MKHLLAKALRRAANRLDPPKPFIIYGNTLHTTSTATTPLTYTLYGDK